MAELGPHYHSQGMTPRTSLRSNEAPPARFMPDSNGQELEIDGKELWEAEYAPGLRTKMTLDILTIVFAIAGAYFFGYEAALVIFVIGWVAGWSVWRSDSQIGDNRDEIKEDQLNIVQIIIVFGFALLLGAIVLTVIYEWFAF